jgi:hypothetical protein
LRNGVRIRWRGLMKTRSTSLILATILLSAVGFSAWAEPLESTSLKAGEIRRALVGKRISYNPPGWADTAISEEFRPDGIWSGWLSGRGPISFSGQWLIKGDQICVTADKGTFAKRWHSGPFCRTVWKDQENGVLRTEYLGDQPSSPNAFGLQTLEVSNLVGPK